MYVLYVKKENDDKISFSIRDSTLEKSVMANVSMLKAGIFPDSSVELGEYETKEEAKKDRDLIKDEWDEMRRILNSVE